MFYEFCTANGGLQNLFLRKFILSQNQGFYEILTLRKFGAIRYIKGGEYPTANTTVEHTALSSDGCDATRC